MPSIFAQPYFKGEPLGYLAFYRTGTLTPAAVYADAEGTVPLTTIRADSAGRYAPIYLDDAVTYRMIEKDAAGTTLRDVDPITRDDGSSGVDTITLAPSGGNDTAAIQAALATGKGVDLGPGNFVVTGALLLAFDGQRIKGAGERITTITATGSFNIISATTAVTMVGASDFTMELAAMTGGYALYNSVASRVTFENIEINNPFNVAFVEGCNRYDGRNIYVQRPRGTRGWHLYGEGSNRSDVLRLVDINIGGLGGGARTWTGIYIDGTAFTLQLSRCTFVNSDRGMHVVDSGVAAPPQFIIAHDLEIDYSAREGIRLEAGDSYWFSDLYQQGAETTAGIYVGPAVNGVRIDGGYVRGNLKEGMDSAGQDISCTGVQFVFNSFPLLATYDAVIMRGTTNRARFTNCALGGLEGVGTVARYGITLEAGGVGLRVAGSDFYGCHVGDINDASGASVPGNVQLVGSGASETLRNERMVGFSIGVQDGGGATATATVVGGAVTAIPVTGGGSDYSVAPSVFILDPAGTGTGATATATISGGVVTGVTVNTAGSGYSANTKVALRSATKSPTLKARWPSLANVDARLEADGTGYAQLANDRGIGLAGGGGVANAVNYVLVSGNATTAAPLMQATGADTNIDLAIAPKGTGRLQLVTPFTANADAPVTGYIEVRDNGGNIRKLAIIA